MPDPKNNKPHRGASSGTPRWLTVLLIALGITIGAMFGVQGSQSLTADGQGSAASRGAARTRPPGHSTLSPTPGAWHRRHPAPTTGPSARPRPSASAEQSPSPGAPTSSSSGGSSVGSVAGWVPDLDDEFSSLDASVWRVRDRQAYSRDAAMVMADNVSVDGGALRLQARHQSVGGRAFTSADLDTYGRYSLPDYFRVEVRAKVPFEQGMWAAPLWIRPADGSSGEIDLVETYGSQAARPIVHQTIHSAYGASHRQTHLQTPFSVVGGDPLGWHTYVVEKTPGAITMWVDGVQTARFDSSNTPWFDTYYEAGKRWSLRSSLQVGGGQGSPDGSTDWSPDKTAMLVDYVHTWTPQ